MSNEIESNIFALLGFKVFLIKGAQQDSSYVLYENETRKFNISSKNQITDIISKMIVGEMDLVRNIHFKLKDQSKEYDFFQNGKKIHLSKILISFAMDREVLAIDTLGYSPTPNLIFEDSNEQSNFNAFKTNKYLDGIAYVSKKNKNFPMIKQIIDNLVGHSDKGYSWLTQRIAAILQKPQEKLTTGIIFHGEQGTGKGILLDTVLNHILGHNYTTIQNKELESDFNGWNYKKLVVHAVEIHPTPGKDISGSLKNLCSDKYFSLRQMRTEAKKVENFSTIFITSNKFIPIKIDKDDRRWTVYKSKKLKDGDNIYHTLMSTFEEEIENFVKYLWNLKIDYSFINKPLENDEKKTLKESCMSSVDAFLNYVNNIGVDNLENVFQAEYGFRGELQIYNRIETKEKFVSYPDFYIYYKQYCNEEGHTLYGKIKFGQQIKFNDIEVKVVKDNGKSFRGLKIE